MGKAEERRIREELKRKPKGKMIRVRATELGFYKNVRRRQGCVFEIPEFEEVYLPVKDEKTGKIVRKVIKVDHFSETWMEKVTPKVPLKDIKMPDGIGPDGKQQRAIGVPRAAVDGPKDEEGVL